MADFITVKQAMQRLGITGLNYHDLLAIARLRDKGVTSLLPVKSVQNQRTFLLDVQSLQDFLETNSLN
jgi:hypothetical protein